MVTLDRDNDPDEGTNRIVRGSLRMVAALLDENAGKPGVENPGPSTSLAFEAARRETLRGL